MALTNAQTQARFHDRHRIVLTSDAASIAMKLMAMEDQAKLALIAAYLADHLKHPERIEPLREVMERGRKLPTKARRAREPA